MFTADQLVAHAIGDYVIQSDWMATEKVKQSMAAFVHALVYSLVFLAFSPSVPALAFIFVTHFVIDRWRLARYVVWAKNWLAWWPWCPSCHGPVPADAGVVGVWSADCPQDRHPHRIRPTPPWAMCMATGYPPDRPIWLTFWLMIVVDNLLHVCCNAIALRWL